MFDFLSKFFGRPASSATAKERLRLVLLSDHLSLAPDVVESLKHDLIEVISRYVEVDVPNCDVTFEQREHEVAMLANIPILSINKRTPPPAPPRPPAGPPPERAPEPVAQPAPAFEPLGIGAAPFTAVPQPSGAVATADAAQRADAIPASTPRSQAATDAVVDASSPNSLASNHAPAGADLDRHTPLSKQSSTQNAPGAKSGRRRRRKAGGALTGQTAKAG
ncbi:MAG TPA: cell division topological specificity factor MinE [Candidatus Baltobacteraceae bacterium]|nr:cell division topological specificity factor MinE [Candidatus Baltobacteraceae bacterium]